MLHMLLLVYCNSVCKLNIFNVVNYFVRGHYKAVISYDISMWVSFLSITQFTILTTYLSYISQQHVKCESALGHIAFD